MEDRTHPLGGLAIIIALMIFGISGVFINWYSHIHIFTFVLWFQIMAFIPGFAWRLIKGFERVTAWHAKYIAGIILFTLLNDILLYYSYRCMDLASATLIHQMEGVIILFIAPMIVGEKNTKLGVYALLISLIGTVFIWLGSPGNVNAAGICPTLPYVSEYTTGMIFAAITAILMAFFVCYYNVLGTAKRFGRNELHVTTVNLWRHLVAAPVMLVFIYTLPFLTGEVIRPFETSSAAVGAVYGLLFGAIASSIFHNWGLMKTPPLLASTINNSEAVFVWIFGLLLLSQNPGWQMYIGGIILLGANIVVIYHTQSRPKKAT